MKVAPAVPPHVVGDGGREATLMVTPGKPFTVAVDFAVRKVEWDPDHTMPILIQREKKP